MKTVCIYHRIDLDNETWKKVPKFDYEVSNYGRIKSLDKQLKGKNNSLRNKKGQLLKQSYDKNGYLRVALSGITKKSHRLVAESFVDNPLKLPEINHIDGNKENNHYSNLEWCNRVRNFNHSKELGLQATSKTSKCSIRVVQLDTNDTILKEFNSIREAENITGICNSTISKVCRGIGKTAGGYKWKFKKENNNE